MSRLSQQLDRLYVRAGLPQLTIARKIRRFASVFEPIAIRVENRPGLFDEIGCDAVLVRRARKAIAVACDFRRLRRDQAYLVGRYAVRPSL